MDQAIGYLNKYVVPSLTAISENRYMSAIRAGMMATVPLTIIGGFFMIVAYMPITWGSPALSKGDVKDLPSLAAKLTKSTGAVSAYVNSRLSVGSRQALAAYQSSESNPAVLESHLLRGLNEIITGVSIYEEERFAGITLRDATQQLLERKPQGNDLARLNRLLLEDAYPAEISRKITGWDILVAPYLRLLEIPVTATFGLLSIFVCFSIAYDLGKQWKLEAVVSGSMALLVFLMVQIDIKDQSLAMNGLDSKGVFTAILIAMIVVRVQKFFNDKNFVIKLPDNVPSVVYESFLSLVPLFFLVLVFWVIRFVLEVDINGLIQTALKPLMVGLDTLPGILLYAFMVTMLWSVGINGDNAVDAIVAPVFLVYLGANLEAMKQGQPLPYVTALGFFTTFVNVGGTGATIALAMVLWFSKEPGFRKVSRVAMPTQIFQVNEPMFFGIPIVLNPIFMIPYVLNALVLTTGTYLLMYFDVIQRPFVAIPWTTPPIIGHYLVSGGDWKAAVWGVVSLAIAMVVYYPFAKVAERQRLQEEAASSTSKTTTSVVAEPQPLQAEAAGDGGE